MYVFVSRIDVIDKNDILLFLFFSIIPSRFSATKPPESSADTVTLSLYFFSLPFFLPNFFKKHVKLRIP